MASRYALSEARWSDLPERYGKYKSVHKRFVHWARKTASRPSSPSPVPGSSCSYISIRLGESSTLRGAIGLPRSIAGGDPVLKIERGSGGVVIVAARPESYPVEYKWGHVSSAEGPLNRDFTCD